MALLLAFISGTVPWTLLAAPERAIMARGSSRLAGLAMPFSLWAMLRAARYTLVDWGDRLDTERHQVTKPLMASAGRGQEKDFPENSSNFSKAFHPLSYLSQVGLDSDEPISWRKCPLRDLGMLAPRGASMPEAEATKGARYLDLAKLGLGPAGPRGQLGKAWGARPA